MAEASLDSVDCPLCGKKLKELVTLGCEHRFCHRCLRETWAPSQTGDCPKCNRRWSKELPLHFALKEKDNLSQRQTEGSDKETGEMEKEGGKRPEQTAEEGVSPERELCQQLQPSVNAQQCPSEDLTSERERNTVQDVLPTPERFTYYSPSLCSEGYSLGWRWWVVEVGDHPDWSIGVVTESAERRAMCKATPEEGFWCLTYRDNEYTDISGKTLALSRRLEKFCVLVNLEHFKGRVYFYNKDWTLLCSHRVTFTERVFPYFSFGEADGTNVSKTIKIYTGLRKSESAQYDGRPMHRALHIIGQLSTIYLPIAPAAVGAVAARRAAPYRSDTLD